VIRPLLFAAVGSLAWVLLGTAPVMGQVDPFAGWDTLVEDQYTFDVDERSLLGFSVRAPVDARSALDDAERSLMAGAVDVAAEQLLAIVRTRGSQVMQVGGGDDRWNSRWVGAAEWALFQLLTRVPLSRRQEVLSAEEQAELVAATSWHDRLALSRLALEHEGLPSALPAYADLARLQAEEGRFAAARATLYRLRQLGGEALAETLASPLPGVAAPSYEPFSMGDGTALQSSWLDDSGGDRELTVIARLTDQDVDWINPFIRYSGTYEAPYAPLVPVIADGVVYVADTVSVWAQDLLSGRRLWHHSGPLEVVTDQGTASPSFTLGVYANGGRPKAINPHQVAQPLVTGDHVVATVQVAEPRHPLQSFDGYPINHPLPRRRLRALDRVTGEVLWTQERPALPDNDFVNHFDVDGPVVTDGRAVFASGSVTEGAINAYLAAFDLDSGALLWRTPICSGQQELTMFNRPFQEHVISPPTLHEGSLYVCTNLGVIGCVDAWSGRVRWLAAYESIARRSSRMIRPQNSRDVHWLNQPPLVIDDVVILTPLDSEWLQGLDRRTGRRLYELPTQMGSSMRQPLRHQVVDVGEGRFAVVNDEFVECFNATSGHMEWFSRPFGPFQELSGAAVVNGGRLLVPAEPLLISLDLSNGQRVGDLSLPTTGPGRKIQRVVPDGPALVMTDGASVFAFVDHELVRRDAVASLGHDPLAALTLGELALAENDERGAVVHFERVLAAGPSREVMSRARGGLLEAALSVALAADTPEAWQGVLEAAWSQRVRFTHAEQVLKAFVRLGADVELADGLAVLADADPEHLLTLNDDGPLPVALHFAMSRIPLQSPSEQVASLQELLRSGRQVKWDGLPLAEAAAQRIAALLVHHGPELYAPFEAAAASDLAAGATLAELEARYPNAQVVAQQRVSIMEQLLAEGELRRVFEEARDVTVPALVALRARAARAMGEDAYADVLEGLAPAASSELPALPRDASGLLRVVLSENRSLELHHATGQASPEFAGTLLASIHGTGAFLALDTRTGEVLWDDLPLPGNVLEHSSNLDFHFHGETLLVRGRGTLQALALATGELIWERTLPGRVYDVLPMAGLLISLTETSGRFRVEGHGMATGARAFRIDLPEAEDVKMVQAGDQLVCLSTGGYERNGRGRDKRLAVLDLVGGVVSSSTALADRFSIANTVSDPGVVLLSRSAGRDTVLMAFRPDTAEVLWEIALPEISLKSRMLFASADDQLVLRAPWEARGADGSKHSWDEIIPIDALRGPQEAVSELPMLKVIDPDSDFAPRVVMADPAQPHRLQVLSGDDLSRGYALELPDAVPLGATSLHHGRDGFVLLSSPYPSPVTSVQVVRGERGTDHYFVQVDDGGSQQIELVEGAIVLAHGGVLSILRSALP